MIMRPPKIPNISLSSKITQNDVSPQYTILNPDNIYYTVVEYAKLFQATAKLPKELASFKPERLFMHEACIAYVTTARSTKLKETERLAEMQQRILATIKSIQSSENYQAHIEEVNKLRSEIKANIAEALKNLKHPYYKYITKATSLLKSDFVSDESLIEVIATNLCYNEQAPILVRAKAKPLIETAFKNIGITLLTSKECSTRINFMVSGGTASGKGYNLARLMKQAEAMHADWLDYVRVNTDSFKSVIQFSLHGGSIISEDQSVLASQYMQDEAGILKSRTVERLNEMLETGTAPSLIFDQNAVDKAAVELCTKNGGQLFVIFVTTPIETAIRRSLERGSKDGRYESPQAMLSYHRDATEATMHTIFDPSLKGRKILLEIVDNSNEHSEPITMMNIDFAEGEVTIAYDCDLSKLYNKMNINTAATGYANLYNKKFTNEEVKSELESSFRSLGYNVTTIASPNASSQYRKKVMAEQERTFDLSYCLS